MKYLTLLLTLLIGISAQATDIEGTKAILRGVDKVTGRTNTSTLKVGVPKSFANMRITVKRCLTRPPEETPENAAFMIIEEEKQKGVFETVFNGWMFSSNPALSAMEHPIFDVWLLSCETEEPVSNHGEVIPIKTVSPVSGSVVTKELEELPPEVPEDEIIED